MKRIHKLPVFALCIALTAMLFSGCTQKDEAPQTRTQTIYATVYPLYALSAMLIENVPNARIQCLIQPQDGCLRSYALSDWDYALLQRSADIVLLGGRGLESFESVLYNMGESGPAVIELLHNADLMRVSAANVSEDSESHWLDENPHLYMSVDGAILLAERIAAALITIDSENESIYAANLQAAKTRLEALKSELEAELKPFSGKRVIVMNEALVYAASDLNFEIALCYGRESGEEIDGNALEDCIEMLKTADADVVMIEKQAPRALLNALESAGFHVAALDVLSTHHADEGAEGYFTALRKNAAAIKAAFESSSEVNP